MFLFTYKKFTDVWNSEVGFGKWIEKTEVIEIKNNIDFLFYTCENNIFYMWIDDFNSFQIYIGVWHCED